MNLKRRLTSGKTRRAAVLYLTVFGTAVIITVVALAAMTAVRVQARVDAGARDVSEASVLAMSAVEYAFAKLESLTVAGNPTWRTIYTSGVETPRVNLGSGTISFTLVDETDGNLANNPGNSIRILGIGRVGGATRVYSVKAGGTAALTCLNAAMTVNSGINLNTATIEATGWTVASNASIAISEHTTVNANLEAVGLITGEPPNGSSMSSVPVRGMPGSEVFDYYLTNGTSIAINSIPFNTSGVRAIRNALVSPARNPYGTTNAQGIYVIDCQGQQLRIYGCRIVGTLVLLNPGVDSRVGDLANGYPINWVPAVSNYPCLLVRGGLTLSFNGLSGMGTGVEESLAGNLNPPGTPYPYATGATNTTAVDIYPSEIAGLVYVSGNANADNWWPRINMLVAGGTYSAMNTLYLKYDPTYYSKPPPGFTGQGPMAAVSGTWRWAALP